MPDCLPNSAVEIRLGPYQFQVPLGHNIIVLANYRTGSTALCDVLAQQTGYINRGEAFHWRQGAVRAQLGQEGQREIIKIMPNHQDSLAWAGVFEQAYLIGCRRQDFAAQVVSYAHAQATGVWEQIGLQGARRDRLPLRDLVRWAEWLAQQQREYEACRGFFDQELIYEYIQQDLRCSQFQPHQRSGLYDQQVQELRQYLQGRYDYHE